MSIIMQSARRGGGAAGTTLPWLTNLPAGMTLYGNTDGLTSFAQIPVGGAASPGQFLVTSDSAYLVEVTDPTAPFGITTVARADYPGNWAGGGTGGTSIITTENNTWKEYYACLAVKFRDNYVWHTNGEKFWYPLLHDQYGAQGYWVTDFIGYPSSLPQTSYLTVSRNGELADKQPDVSLHATRGNWFIFEQYAKMNTPGNNDGALYWWINGVPMWSLINQRPLASDGGGQNFFHIFRITGTWGAGDSALLTPPEGQSRYYSRLALYTKS